MLLAIDVGNTNSVFALFDGAKQIGLWRAATNAQRTADEYVVFLLGLMQKANLDPQNISHVIIGSVVPEANFNLLTLSRECFKCEPMIVGKNTVDLGIKIKLERPDEAGADRLINAVAGLATYKPPLLLIDFGTATTFDVVDAEGAYCGGAIAPGINLSLQALHMAAAKLPRVAVTRPKRVIGTGTVEAMQSGIYWGYVGLIEGMITRIQQEFAQPMTVVATGGLASLFRESIPAIKHLDADLTLRGLHLIFERNRK